MHLSNDSDQVLKNISVAVIIKDAQSKNQSVWDTTAAPKSELKPQQVSDYIIRIHLTEPGQHVLGIQAAYQNQTGDTRTLTKHFKFLVNKPLAVESSLVSSLPVRAHIPTPPVLDFHRE